MATTPFPLPPDDATAPQPLTAPDLMAMLAQSAGQVTGPVNPLAALRPPTPPASQNPAQDFINANSADTPEAARLRVMHMAPEDVAARSAMGNRFQQAKNIFEQLIGHDYQKQGVQEYDARGRRLSTDVTELKNQDLAKRAEANLILADKYKGLHAQSEADKNLIAQQLADTKQQQAETQATKVAQDAEIKKQMAGIADASQRAKAGDMTARQEVAKRSIALAEKYPHLGSAETILARAMTTDGQALDIPEYIKHVGEMKQATTPPVLKDLPTFNDSGVQNGIQVVPLDRFSGARRNANAAQPQPGDTPATPATPATPGVPGAPAPTAPTIPFGSTGNGNTVASPGVMKAVQAAVAPRDSAMVMGNNLLRDLSTGKIKSYTGPLWGNPTVAKIRAMVGGDSSGEELMQRLSSSNVLEGLRALTGGRMNQTEVKNMTASMGGQSMDGESVTKRALLNGLIQDMNLEKAKGRDINSLVTNPEFTQSMRDAVENAIALAKKTKGAYAGLKAPAVSDVLQIMQQKAAKNTSDIRDQVANTLLTPEEIKKRRAAYNLK